MSRLSPLALTLVAGLASTALLAGCGKSDKAETADTAPTPAAAAPAGVAVVFPPSLVTIGDGYPNAGNPCRRVGESPATSQFLDDSAVLIGCPGGGEGAASQAIVGLGGRVVGMVDGFTLLSVPTGDANAGLDQAKPTPSTPPAASTPPGSRRVQFQPGAVGASLAGSVKGYDTPSYIVGARAGQQMTVRIAGSPNASFNIFAPGDRPGESEAMFIGDVSGDRYVGVLPESGDYTIQIGQPRAMARRGESADFRLDVRVTSPGE